MTTGYNIRTADSSHNHIKRRITPREATDKAETGPFYRKSARPEYAESPQHEREERVNRARFEHALSKIFPVSREIAAAVTEGAKQLNEGRKISMEELKRELDRD